jgi:anti-sigma regulatory factor (Ser/Thr protein kinase)
LEIVLKNQPSEKQRVGQALEHFGRQHALPDAAIRAADLALEEHLTNLMKYGFADNLEHQIKVRFSLPADFVVEVEDDGRPFNPLNQPEVDITTPLDSKPIGGLGIHLMRRCMDHLEYHSHDGKNVLRMRKRLAG